MAEGELQRNRLNRHRMPGADGVKPIFGLGDIAGGEGAVVG